MYYQAPDLRQSNNIDESMVRTHASQTNQIRYVDADEFLPISVINSSTNETFLDDTKHNLKRESKIHLVKLFKSRTSVKYDNRQEECVFVMKSYKVFTQHMYITFNLPFASFKCILQSEPLSRLVSTRFSSTVLSMYRNFSLHLKIVSTVYYTSNYKKHNIQLIWGSYGICTITRILSTSILMLIIIIVLQPVDLTSSCIRSHSLCLYSLLSLGFFIG
ncbi:unnamed protein product [Schistosoma mansoni]|uniref:Smp_202350 n=1 Tax=Schistosoma mansoni TaxID=6183 RepID=G4LW69_SCHMA|nr:unnamed protein product [Schistosoma mansoni]|eukprot:XP_018645515.1 unnamed protein product [Schistosoma mansoni]